MTLVLVLLAAFVIWKVIKKASSEASPTKQQFPGIEFRVETSRAATTRHESPARRQDARWVPATEALRIQGLSIPGGLVYVGSYLESPGRGSVEPALIDPSLGIERRSADYDQGMDYWPAYGRISPANRGAYLSWLAGGRSDPNAYIGYVFLFFYGLERRVLLDRSDVREIRSEVCRLQGLYGGNRSFRGYSSDFMAFTAHMVPDLSEHEMRQQLAEALDRSELTRAALLAWYCARGLPLPPACAAAVASSLEEAKRGVVVTRSRSELYALFAKRYLEQHGQGITLVGAARDLAVSYHAASSGLALGARLEARWANPLGRPSQFKPLVTLWNSCVEDLRKYSSAQRKSASPGELTAAMWEAMPAELRAQYDHPEQESWENAISQGQACGRGHLVTAKALGELSGMGPRERYTSVQLRKAANTAATVGFAIEPDPRVGSGSCEADALFVVWPSAEMGAPDPSAYSPAATVLKLAMHIAQADGTVDPQELSVMSEVLETIFSLDEPLRARLEHLRELLLIQPAKATALAKKIADSSTPEKCAAVGRLLVAIAAADGVLHDAEHKALRAMYKALGLSAAALDGALVATGVKLGADEVVAVSKGERAGPGSAVTAPKTPDAPAVRLNQKAIESILADTHQVASLLADAFGDGDDSVGAPSPEKYAVPAGEPALGTGPALPPWAAIASELEPRYRAVLFELAAREHWSRADVQALASRSRMMPVAIMETINAWADDALGDYLIAGDDDWTIRTDLIRSMAS